MGARDRLDSFLTRRAFVGWMGKGAAVFALGGVIRIVEGKEVIRPPGALPEPEFLTMCIRCDRCRLECPYNYISMVPITESLSSFGTPQLLGQDHGQCPRCKRCVFVCPTGALRNDR